MTEAGRKAKYYGLTAAGRKQLAARKKSWEQVVKGVQAILRYTRGDLWVYSAAFGRLAIATVSNTKRIS